MKISEQEAKKFTIPGGVEGLLYPQDPNGQFSVAVVQQDGVYPKNGWSINDICTETLYVLEGSLEVDIEEHTHVVQAGDMVIVHPKHKYRVRGTAKTIDVITPAWDKKQNHIIH